MPWFTFTIQVDGQIEATDEAAAKRYIESEIGWLGTVDYEVFDQEEEDDEPDQPAE